MIHKAPLVSLPQMTDTIREPELSAVAKCGWRRRRKTRNSVWGFLPPSIAGTFPPDVCVF